MFRWTKLGKLYDPRDHPAGNWMDEYAQSPSALIFDDFVRVYFCARPPRASDGSYISFLSYIDLDRRNLLRILRVCPGRILGLGEVGTFDEFGTNPISVIRDGSEVRVYYAGWTRCESVPFNAAIGLAISRDDGASFSRVGAGPVLSYSPDEPFLLGSPRIRKFGERWHIWYVSGKEWLKTAGKPEPVYRIRMASSEDGINWTKHGKDLLEARLGDDECQACADVLFRDGRYHMFFSYRRSHNYRGREGGYRIGYASSPDMRTWERNDEAAGMHPSESGWDSEMVSYPHVFELDGGTYMLYQGNEMGRAGIGLAKLDGTAAWGAR
jgi:predicted GH43/DUF377 family glycosyl hydrolase